LLPAIGQAAARTSEPFVQADLDPMPAGALIPREELASELLGDLGGDRLEAEAVRLLELGLRRRPVDLQSLASE
jgi:hypothetical protein